jgi:protein-S-isoprenylcysteine O-methyltransferase Ste14
VTRLPALGARGEGWVALQLLAISAVALEAAPSRAGPADSPTHLAGLAIAVLGLALIAWASLGLQRAGSFTGLPRPRADGNLVTSGAHRIVRHPIYAGLVMAGAGWSIARESALALACSVVLFVVLDLKRRREEAWLVERFPGYEAYRATTRALIPFVY